MSKFEDFRNQYNSFLYKDYSVEYIENAYRIVYHFEIPGLCEFQSKWEFPAKERVNETILKALAFHLGMAETISYWKCACPKQLKILCGTLSAEQKTWWKKLYYNGLGEFMYRNGIVVSEEELVTIECEENVDAPMHDTRAYDGCLVSVGGGKDSVVSLEVLKGEKITTYSINGNATTKNVIAVCDHKQGDYAAKRILDKKILELNAAGYLNGHIPFSAVVAFSSFISAFLSGNRYIVLSNETSANETTVKDSFVNHQYSKSFEFEQDFVSYIRKVTDSDIHYFSLLRPLTEMQIAWLFAKCKSYHEVFRSCNAGSKQGIWCCNCPKCLFVYIILTPFLSQEELVHIFGENLLEKDSLDLYFRELTGIEENKPFECVGTRREVLVALKTFIARGGKSLLTERYKETIEAAPGELDEMLSEWVSENQVPEYFLQILKDFMKRA